MAKIVLLFILIIVLFFPVYENSKIKIAPIKNLKKNIPISTIKNAKFFVYEGNLSKKGRFSIFDIYKNLYIAKNIYIQNLLKKEEFFAKKAIFENNILKFFDFKFKNNEYSLLSNYVIYNIKSKSLKGERFFLYSKDFNGSGSSFFVDRYRDIKAENISFYLKVNK